MFHNFGQCIYIDETEEMGDGSKQGFQQPMQSRIKELKLPNQSHVSNMQCWNGNECAWAAQNKCKFAHNQSNVNNISK